jgi:CxxC motif-containing protein (DUF1111 family)
VRTRAGATFALACAALAACGGGSGVDTGEPSPLAGGDGSTVSNRSSKAYSFPAPGLTADELGQHAAGDAAFEAKFVTAPAPVHPGLGPVFNNVSCAACHLGDGRGMPVVGDGPLRSHMLVRVSTAAGDPLPGIGSQIQDHAIFGVEPEATVTVTYEDVPGTYGDGAPYTLRRPILSVTLPGGGGLPDGTLTSLRQTPPVFGRGLLEAVPEAEITSHADPDDADGDGISGRPNYVPDAIHGGTSLGRFGLKANNASLREQTAAAYRNDIGITNSIFREDDGVTYELDDATLDATTFYTQTLAVPARVDVQDAQVLRGQALFRSFGCAACHLETLTTGDYPVASNAHQTIHPYSDLLLHDMGDDLADGRPDGQAGGHEWRTSPLWGLGVAQTVLPGSAYLHDGRARDFAEAVLWHGGEAQASREAFRTAPPADRDALLRFLLSL